MWLVGLNRGGILFWLAEGWRNNNIMPIGRAEKLLLDVEITILWSLPQSGAFWNKGLCVGPSLGLSKRTSKYWFVTDLGQIRAFTSHTWLSDSKSKLHHAPPCHDFAWSFLAICDGIATPRLCMVIPVNLPNRPAIAPPVCNSVIANGHKSSGQTDTYTLINVGRRPAGPYRPRLRQ